MQKWEYLTVTVDNINEETTVYANHEQIMKRKSVTALKDLPLYLNSLGEQGWEMVNAQNREQGFGDYYFKRPLE